MARQKIITIGILVIITTILLAFREWSLQPDGHTHFYFLDVGQGDSALIVTPSGKHIVMDGGPDWKALEGLGKYLPFFSRRIDLLTLSHPHLDHYASFPESLKRYDVKTLVISNVESHSPWIKRIRDTANARGTAIKEMHAGETIDLGDHLNMNLLWPPEKLDKSFTTDLNNTSLVFKLSDGIHRALLTGDAEEPVEATLLAAHVDLKADLLKAGHHGSKTSSSTGFLLAVHPNLAVVSVGVGNSFGHPNPGVMKRYETLGIPTRRTDQEGTIEVVW